MRKARFHKNRLRQEELNQEFIKDGKPKTVSKSRTGNADQGELRLCHCYS